MVGLLAFAARGHEVARDHRHVALARRACADVALVAGVAERAHGLLRDADTQTALSFQHVALDVLERHALQAQAGEDDRPPCKLKVLRAGVGQGVVADLMPAAGCRTPWRQLRAPRRLVAVARRVEVEGGPQAVRVQQRDGRLQLGAHPIVKGERNGPLALARPGALTRRSRSQPNHITPSTRLKVAFSLPRRTVLTMTRPRYSGSRRSVASAAAHPQRVHSPPACGALPGPSWRHPRRSRRAYA